VANPNLKRSPSVFHVESGRLTPGDPVERFFPLITVCVGSHLGQPLICNGLCRFFSIDADGTAMLDTSDGAHVDISITATGPGSASGVVKASTSPSFRAGLILTRRRGKAPIPG
jgi:hypothetical protein